ncbi:MAG: hypothetical protein WD227_07620 [Vicinamibacterales bacterium]
MKLFTCVLSLVSLLLTVAGAAAQGPSVTSASMTEGVITVAGHHLTGTTAVVVGGLDDTGLSINGDGTVLMGTVIGALLDGSHLLAITRTGSTPGTCGPQGFSPGFVCTAGGGCAGADDHGAPAVDRGPGRTSRRARTSGGRPPVIRMTAASNRRRVANQ